MNQATAIAMATPSLEDAQRSRLLFCLFCACTVAYVLMRHANSLLLDPDSWWQVKVGLDFLANRTFPTVDPYSYTFAGQPWIAKEWLGQVLLALAYGAGGWNGVVTLIIATIGLTVFLMGWFLSAWLKPVLAVVLAFVAAFLVAPIYTARPHVFTLPIIVIWTAMLFRAAQEERAPSPWLLALVVLWANLHATFTLSFVIAGFAGLYLLSRIGLSKPVLLAKWVAFGLLCPVVSLVHPYGVKAILATLTVAYGNEAVPLILEWRPFNAQEELIKEAVMLLALFGLLVSRLRIGWAKALFILFTLHAYLSHQRFMYLFFLLVPLVIMVEVAQQYPALSAATWLAQKRDGLEKVLARHYYAISGAVAVLLIGAVSVLGSVQQIAPSPKTSASGALAFARDQQLSGNVLNSYNFGGTLIFHGIKTYIDGRTDQLFLDGFTKTDDATGHSDGKPLLEARLKKYAIGWALLAAGDTRIPFFEELGWKRAYADEYAVIYLPGA
ncbi:MULTISPECIES: hypothetical protein [unclassified Mesorhizobium]|uniref:hypothetical protein n=1 Tax=unclassified Mesorhizobium TaxID=325217 RepID=UPI00112E8C4F|nr:MULTISPECIES: hypothetical protein [unclassified Mesorhizobium]TPJ49541.1 hypothetical protein FJ437_04760 [Mesorhizobium sp. B2-6-6]MBZ9916570.1 hypothetical protein [Mesorhizobium sp. BR1-1-7]MBZ9972612.1 hypothetical protein [Mesorhizobium sp. BR1-1-12]MCA0000717.1 hypothetical protein [Mesorhizobium sp. B264B2A]MCA0007198.1 hypothetical protein [Mesorhizobium sp. B264B1B]